ncbi:MAG: hypothetical protein NVSMB31_17280 [Vulcanimicrobiaceae bacterium]
MLLLIVFGLTVAPANASLYDARGVGALVAATPQITAASKRDSEGRTTYSVQGAQVGGFIVPDMVDDGYLADGHEVLIVPLASGGSGGVFTTLLWTRTGNAWRFVGYIPSNGHLNVHIEQGALHVITPVYATGEPNCCPSKHHYVRYTLSGIHLKQLEEFTAP